MSLNWILSQLIAEWIFQTFRGWISRYLHLSTYLHTSSIPATVWSFLKRLFWLINDKAADVYLLLLLFSYYTNEITLPLNAIITSILKRYLLVLPILRPLPPFLSTSSIVPPHSATSSIVLNILDFESIFCVWQKISWVRVRHWCDENDQDLIDRGLEKLSLGRHKQLCR